MTNATIAVKRCGSPLRHGAIVRRGIQSRVDWTRRMLLAVMPWLPSSLIRAPLFICFSAACVVASMPGTLMLITRYISSIGFPRTSSDSCVDIVH